MVFVIRRFLLVVTALLSVWAVPVLAQAVTRFDLPSQPLADSLRAVGGQTHTNILFDTPLVAGRTAPSLKGEMATDQALDRLLAGSGIRYEFLNDATVVLAAHPTGPSRGTSDAQALQQNLSPQDAGPQEAGKSSSQGFRVAQVDQTPAGTALAQR